MRNNNKKLQPGAILTIVWALILAVVLITAFASPSEASETHEIVTEGYEGSDRIIVVEKPVKAKSNTSRKQGWIGDKRIDLKVVRTKEYTQTKGWEGDQYINVKERKDE